MGLSGAALSSPVALTSGFHKAMVICAALMALAALASAALVDNGVLRPRPGRLAVEPECLTNCAVGAPPLEPGNPASAAPAADRH